jgi:hypothetical protein
VGVEPVDRDRRGDVSGVRRVQDFQVRELRATSPAVRPPPRRRRGTPQGSVLVAVVLDAESALAGNRNGHALPTLGEPWPSWSWCQSVIFGRARHKPKASRRMDV